MTQEQRQKKQEELVALVKKWPRRLKKLSKRKKEPLSERQFCLKWGMHPAPFNRAKNLVCFPREKSVMEVEKALEAEGV